MEKSPAVRLDQIRILACPCGGESSQRIHHRFRHGALWDRLTVLHGDKSESLLCQQRIVTGILFGHYAHILCKFVQVSLQQRIYYQILFSRIIAGILQEQLSQSLVQLSFAEEIILVDHALSQSSVQWMAFHILWILYQLKIPLRPLFIEQSVFEQPQIFLGKCVVSADDRGLRKAPDRTAALVVIGNRLHTFEIETLRAVDQSELEEYLACVP